MNDLKLLNLKKEKSDKKEKSRKADFTGFYMDSSLPDLGQNFFA